MMIPRRSVSSQQQHQHQQLKEQEQEQEPDQKNKKILRLAHITDLHFQHTPSPLQLLGKRLIGSTNLWVVGRRHEFSADAAKSAICAVRKQEADAVLVSGDLTAQALPQEFETARRELRGLLNSQPSLLVPGNHDEYTSRSFRERRTDEYMREWMGLDPIIQTRHQGQGPEQSQGQGQGEDQDQEEEEEECVLPSLRVGVSAGSSSSSSSKSCVEIIGMNPCRPTMIGSAGLYRQWQLDALERHLQRIANVPAVKGVVIMTHYPVMPRPDDSKAAPGQDYEQVHPNHGAEQTAQFVDIVDNAPVKPSLIIHGHLHNAFTARTPGGVLIANPGSGGHAWYQPANAEQAAAAAAAEPNPDRRKREHVARAAAFNVYSFDFLNQPEDGRFIEPTITRFVQEAPGGAFVPGPNAVV